MKSRI